MTAKTAPFRYTVGLNSDYPIAAFRYQVDAEQWAIQHASLLRDLPENHGSHVRVYDAGQSGMNIYAVLV